MTEGVELGSYYVSILPSARGVGSGIESALGPQVDSAAAKAARSLSGGIRAGAEQGAAAAEVSTRKIGGSLESLGGTATRIISGIAVGGLARAALGEAEEARQVAAQTEAVLRSTGNAAGLTAGHISNLAGELSNLSGIDDEVIQSGENLLLTFKSIRNEAGAGNDIFDQATRIALDMSVAIGQDLTSSITMVGKALEDPIRGVTALRRVGANFTEEQQAQIQALVDTGNKMQAQKLILRELTSEYGNSAKAQASSSDKAKVAIGNLEESIGAGLLPALDFASKRIVQITGLFDRLPSPMRTVVSTGLLIGGAAVVFGGAIKSAALSTATAVGSLVDWAVTARVSTAATEGLAAAMSAEAVAAQTAGGSTAAAAASGRTAGVSMGGAAGKITLAAAAFWGLGKGLGVITDMIYGAGPAVDSLATSLTNLALTGTEKGELAKFGGVDKIVDNLAKLQKASTGTRGALSDTTNAILHVGTLGGFSGKTPIDNLTKKVNAVDDALASMVKSGHAAEAKTAFDLIAEAAERQGVSLDEVRHHYNNYVQAATDAGVASDSAAHGLTDFTAAADEAASKTPFTDALSNMRQMADDTRASLKEVAGAAREALGIKLAVPEAQDAQATAQQQFSDALREAREKGYSGDFLTGTDQTSRDIRAKYRDLQRANADLIGAWRETGVVGDDLKGKVNSLGGEFIDAANRVWVGRDAINDYIGSLHEMVKATDDAQRHIDALNLTKLTDAWNASHIGSISQLTPAQFGNATFMSGIQGLLDLQQNGRASGGPVAAGELYRVNENRMEFFRPGVSGTVLPLAPPGTGMGGGGVTIQQNFTDARPSAAAIAREAAAHANWALVGRSGR